MLSSRDLLVLEVMLLVLEHQEPNDIIVIDGGGKVLATTIEINTIHGNSFDQVILDDLAIPEPMCCSYDDHWREPLPRPPKFKPRLHRAPQQSFRSRMRSVNRNR